MHRETVVVDLHAHGPGFVPQPFRALYRGLTPRAPAPRGLETLRSGGVDAAVVSAVGDPIVTRWYRGRSPWQAVAAQLDAIEERTAEAGGRLVGSLVGLAPSRAADAPAVLLGVEGADAIGADVDRIDAWYERGVRSVVLVHLADNQLGTTCLPWQRYAGPLPVRRRRRPGLSPLGVRVVARMNRLGMVVDVAHSDRATLLDTVAAATAPVMSSHTGARALQDFARYLADDELRAVASTGGVIGVWPFRHRGVGVRDLAALVAHARHIAEVIGPEHLAVGTDLNGVPGVMAGYDGPRDLPRVTEALLDAGFSATEVRGVLGGNALRMWQQIEAPAQP